MIAVVAHHLVGWPSGGFLGVDVFFVISGFLITGLLLREHRMTGRISLVTFYRRRARRILPAAAVCLAVIVAMSWIVYRSARFAAIGADAGWAMVFAANWHAAAMGTDYLSATGPESPVQHFWSLAVEEQFYLVWPLLLIVLLSRAAGRRSTPRRLLAVFLSMIVIGSFALAVLQTASSPTWAYFSTLTRVWEIGLGALLAVIAHRFVTLTPVLRSALSVGGLLMIGAGLVVIDTAMPVPGPWAAVPVIGTLLVLAGGTGRPSRHLGVLTNRAALYVGDRSYSLYLWHFPVIVLLAAVLPSGPASVAIAVVVMACLAVGSYRLVEMPFRSGSSTMRLTWRRRPVWLLVGVATVLAGAVVVSIGGRLPPDTSAGAGTGEIVADGPIAQLTSELDAALSADRWPELQPAIDGISETGRPPKDADCAIGLADPDEPTRVVRGVNSAATHLEGAAAACSFGAASAPRLAVVAGDSIAISWIPLIQAVLEPRGYRIQGLTMSGCPFVSIDTRNPAANITAQCPAHKAATVDAIRSLEPDLVVVANTYEPWLRGEPGLDDGAVRYAAGQRSVIDEFARPDLPVFVLAPPPPGLAPEECATTSVDTGRLHFRYPRRLAQLQRRDGRPAGWNADDDLRRHLLLVLLVGRSVSEFRRAYPGPPRRRRPCGAGLRPTPGPVARADHAHLNLRLRTRCCPKKRC